MDGLVAATGGVMLKGKLIDLWAVHEKTPSGYVLLRRDVGDESSKLSEGS